MFSTQTRVVVLSLVLVSSVSVAAMPAGAVVSAASNDGPSATIQPANTSNTSNATNASNETGVPANRTVSNATVTQLREQLRQRNETLNDIGELLRQQNRTHRRLLEAHRLAEDATERLQRRGHEQRRLATTLGEQASSQHGRDTASRLREHVGEQEATADSLRTRLTQSNQTLATLREQHRQQTQTYATLRTQLNQTQALVDALENGSTRDRTQTMEALHEQLQAQNRTLERLRTPPENYTALRVHLRAADRLTATLQTNLRTQRQTARRFGNGQPSGQTQRADRGLFTVAAVDTTDEPEVQSSTVGSYQTIVDEQITAANDVLAAVDDQQGAVDAAESTAAEIDERADTLRSQTDVVLTLTATTDQSSSGSASTDETADDTSGFSVPLASAAVLAAALLARRRR